MLRLLSREEALGINPCFTEFLFVWREGVDERLRDPFPRPVVDQSEVSVVWYAHKDTGSHEEYSASLARGLRRVGEQLDLGMFHFLGEANAPMWGLEDDCGHPRRRAALEHLGRCGMDETFCGAAQASGDDLEEFLRHFYWTRVVTCHGDGVRFFSAERGAFAVSLRYTGALRVAFYANDFRDRFTRAMALVGCAVIDLEEESQRTPGVTDRTLPF